MKAITLPENKLVIGLTGNIATGKSAVLHLAAGRGALTIDADQEVHEILASDTAVKDAIVNVFGPTVRQPDGRINRSVLGEIVFNDSGSLRKLEQIVHPAVYHRVMSLIGESESPVVMIEAIKLLEGRLHRICNQIWVTYCSRQRQMERLRICRGMDEATAITRIDAQAPQEEKVTQADVVIDTDGLMNDTRNQFDQAWSLLPLSGR